MNVPSFLPPSTVAIVLLSEPDYDAALAEVARLMDAKPGTRKGDRLDVLVTPLEAYEDCTNTSGYRPSL